MQQALQSRRAFTLIEILVAMTIIVILTSILIMGLGGTKAKAMHKASLATVNKVMVALGNYQAAFRDFPPDGYDLGEKKLSETDLAGGWDVNADGVLVGYSPPRRVRGTAALIYFLCRPVVRVTRQSADPGDTSATYTRVGPFLELEAADFSMERLVANGEEVNFDPNYPWLSDFWDEGRKCEIIDAFGRPLCYDKVKTNHVAPGGAGKYVYFNPSLFQDPGAGATSRTGIYAHPDAERYILSGLMPISEDEEPEGFATEADLHLYRCDPRYADKTKFQLLTDALDAGTAPGAGTDGTVNPDGSFNAGTHRPKNVPGYDLWSAGRSWVDPRDDITSWSGG